MAVGPAMEWSAEKSRLVATEQFRNFFDYTLPAVAVLKGEKIAAKLTKVLGDTDITDLWIPYYCVSTNLTTAGAYYHDRGRLVDAVRASVAIPGVLPPVPLDGQLLVDGGILDNVPVDEMRRRNPTGRVIAIDVAPAEGPVADEDYGLSMSGFRAVLARRRRARRPGHVGDAAAVQPHRIGARSRPSSEGRGGRPVPRRGHRRLQPHGLLQVAVRRRQRRIEHAPRPPPLVPVRQRRRRRALCSDHRLVCHRALGCPAAPEGDKFDSSDHSRPATPCRPLRSGHRWHGGRLGPVVPDDRPGRAVPPRAAPRPWRRSAPTDGCSARVHPVRSRRLPPCPPTRPISWADGHHPSSSPATASPAPASRPTSWSSATCRGSLGEPQLKSGALPSGPTRGARRRLGRQVTR